MSEVKISTGHPDAGRVYAEAFDRVTAERDAALGREADLVERLTELRAELNTQSLRADVAVGDANEAEQRLTAADERADVLEGLLRRWDAMWDGGGIHNGPLTKLRQATKSALSYAEATKAPASKSLKMERDMFEEWAAEEAEVRGVGTLLGLMTDEHHDRYSMIWTQTAWLAWQARAALKPAEGGGDE